MNLDYQYWSDHEKWHEYILGIPESITYFELTKLWEEVYNWIVTNVSGYKKHARWSMKPYYIKVKFRYERDYLMFVLRWS